MPGLGECVGGGHSVPVGVADVALADQRERQCASGARSPEQPSEPYSWTTGVMPWLSMAGEEARGPGGRRCARSPA